MAVLVPDRMGEKGEAVNTEELALLASVLDPANFDDDLPRLVYADWCDENGRPVRAEFIRLSIALARLDPLKCFHPEGGSLLDCPNCGAILKRRRELFAMNKPDVWGGPLSGGVSPILPKENRRGFLEVVSGNFGDFVKKPVWVWRPSGRFVELLKFQPIRVVLVSDRKPQHCEKLRLMGKDYRDLPSVVDGFFWLRGAGDGRIDAVPGFLHRLMKPTWTHCGEWSGYKTYQEATGALSSAILEFSRGWIRDRR